MTGVKTRRFAKEEQTTASFCEEAATQLLDNLSWDRNTIDAVIFVSQTPDYKTPSTACILHGRLNLKKACATFDINLGCSGYVYGIWLAAKLLDGIFFKRILLLVGDTMSKIIDPKDQATAMLFGDAGTATAIEYDKRSPDSYFILGSDGSGENNLIIPNSCYKPHIKNNNKFDGHNLDYLFMDGPEVFSFTLKNVPLLLKDLLILSGQKSTDIDKYLFHQANLFMLNYLIKQTNIDIKDAPINIQKFGNTSGATIPLLISDMGNTASGTSYIELIADCKGKQQ